MYRKRTRSNVIVEPSEFTRGRIVWVALEEGGTRHEHVCTGKGTEVVTQDEFKAHQEQQAADNRARHRHSWSRRPSQREWGLGLGW
ncbi:hypothetical protein KW784_00390 [Candidatus Parcubacteria bacterium]|nr:hypothetical protein [Candidatus Parcubacteria bacterium]